MRPWNNTSSAPNGNTVQENFQQWFAQSKIVDALARPLILYHGTFNHFDTFDTDMGYGDADFMFFTPDAGEALHFAQNRADGICYEDDEIAAGPLIMPVYVYCENPFDYEDMSHAQRLGEALVGQTHNCTSEELIRQISQGNWMDLEKDHVQDAIKELGFDGFYAKERGHKNLAIYKPHQVKSALGNSGNYSLDTDSLTDQPRHPTPSMKI